MPKRNSIILVLITILGLTTVTCRLPGGDGPPRNAVVVEVTANTGLTPWLEAAIEGFNDARNETSAGKRIYVTLNPVESGQAVTTISGGGPLPALWIPDDQVWVNLLADQGDNSFQGNCVSVAESPLVIAMWRPVAESLGWPGRSLAAVSGETSPSTTSPLSTPETLVVKDMEPRLTS